MSQLKVFSSKVAVQLAKIVYFPIKRLTKVSDKVVYISRQENDVPQDMRLLVAEFANRHPAWEQVVLAHTLGETLWQRITYVGHMIEQMRQIASARLVVVDSYCIAVSVLRHRPGLKVIQMWHAYGALKRFAFSLVGTSTGISDAGAQAMHMHENYDLVLASSKASVPAFSEAFNVAPSAVKVFPLPRTDLLTSPKYESELRNDIYAAHPELRDRKIALFVPTFRDSEHVETSQLLRSFTDTEYTIVAKGHPFVYDEHSDLNDVKDFTGQDLLAIADVVITDYSSIVFEAALVGLPVYFWTPDLAEYTAERNFYLDFRNDLPGEKFTNADKLVRAVVEGTADQTALTQLAQKYIGKTEHATADIVDEMDRLIA